LIGEIIVKASGDVLHFCHCLYGINKIPEKIKTPANELFLFSILNGKPETAKVILKYSKVRNIGVILKLLINIHFFNCSRIKFFLLYWLVKYSNIYPYLIVKEKMNSSRMPRKTSILKSSIF
jgi:hypothetical protein